MSTLARVSTSLIVYGEILACVETSGDSAQTNTHRAVIYEHNARSPGRGAVRHFDLLCRLGDIVGGVSSPLASCRFQEGTHLIGSGRRGVTMLMSNRGDGTIRRFIR